MNSAGTVGFMRPWRATTAVIAIAATTLSCRARDEAAGPVDTSPARRDSVTATPPADRTARASRVTLHRGRDASAPPLAPGTRVAPGDPLFLIFESPAPAHVYVLEEDPAGAIRAWFPLRGATPGNPLDARLAHRLPGARDGRPFEWSVSGSPGHVDLYLLASAVPLPVLDDEIARVPPAGGPPASYPLIPRERLLRLRGLGGMSQEQGLAGRSHGDLDELIDRLANSAGDGAPAWVWHLTLENRRP